MFLENSLASLKQLFKRDLGISLSITGHFLIVIFALLNFSSPEPFKPASEAIAVEIVSEKALEEMMRGDNKSKNIATIPERKVDKIDDVKKDQELLDIKKNIPTPAKSEPKVEEETNPLQPPTSTLPSPPIAPPKVANVTHHQNIIEHKPPANLRLAPPSRPVIKEEDVKDDEDAEIIKKKVIPPKKEPEKQEADQSNLKKILEEKRIEEQKQLDAKKHKLEEQKKIDILKKIEDNKKAELKKLEDAQKDAIKKAQTEQKIAEQKAKEEKMKKEQAAKEKSDEKKLLASISEKLQISKENPGSSGNSGAVLNNKSSAGTREASGAKLSPSDKAQLVGLLTSQLSKCVSYSGTAPKTGPQISFTLGKDGSVIGAIKLVNHSSESNFIPFAEATMRAIRSRDCQPYNIPAKFLETYDDWKDININVGTLDMQ